MRLHLRAVSRELRKEEQLAERRVVTRRYNLTSEFFVSTGIFAGGRVLVPDLDLLDRWHLWDDCGANLPLGSIRRPIYLDVIPLFDLR